MDLRWQEEQRAFQARVLIDENPAIGLRPYRTFLGNATSSPDRHTHRAERLTVTVITAAVVVSVLLAVGLPRELAAVTAALAGGVALIVAVSPAGHQDRHQALSPLMAVYAPSVLRGARPVCVTLISLDEFERLGTEGFGTVVGDPKPGATFGLFVDEHLVWPRTPPRTPQDSDPGFGSA
jgi:hypothetical protein